jgi:hypothetical protein
VYRRVVAALAISPLQGKPYEPSLSPGTTKSGLRRNGETFWLTEEHPVNMLENGKSGLFPQFQHGFSVPLPLGDTIRGNCRWQGHTGETGFQGKHSTIGKAAA